MLTGKIDCPLLRIVVASSSGLSSPRRVLLGPEDEGNTTFRDASNYTPLNTA